MHWHLSNRADQRARVLADRHYSRQQPGTAQFVQPGRCIVLLTEGACAYWVSSWPFAICCKHEWAGAWQCSAFRNEGAILSSSLIRDALAVTRFVWGEPPELGMITFVDSTKTLPKDKPGWCFRKAGFKHVGYTKGGLVALQILAADMPGAAPAFGVNYRF